MLLLIGSIRWASLMREKRSCRKRLDGHNRRRRKPQPEPLSLNSASTRYLHFGSSQIFSTSAMNTVWTGAAKAESDPMLHTSDQSSMNFGGRKNLFPGSLSFNYKEGKQFPFLQGTCSTVPGDSVHLDGSSTLGNSGNGQKMFSDGLNRAIDSSRALSLLSSPPSGTREDWFERHNAARPELSCSVLDPELEL
ncbi:hypothetical protein OIU78_013418 [Salix suchowensis]|nr:hypothetical protein OIU78_013418 [Salix suchowensis]